MGKPAGIMVNRLPISQARVNLGQVARRAHVGGEYFILEKGGIPVIGIMDAEELEDYLELRNPKVFQQIQQSNADIKSGRIRPASDLVAKPVAAARAPKARKTSTRRQQR